MHLILDIYSTKDSAVTGKGFQLSGIDACLKKPANWAERLFMLGPNVSTSSRFAASVCIVHFSLYVVLCITEIHRTVSQIRNKEIIKLIRVLRSVLGS